MDVVESKNLSDSFIRRIVKASFANCSIEDRALLSKSKCIFPISMGQTKQEGSKLLATMLLISNTFKECDLLLTDSLQRHTLKIDLPDASPQALYSESRAMGNRWLDNNRDIYEKLTIPFNMIRWDYWLDYPDFNEYHAKINHLYDKNKEFKAAIDKSVAEYLDRRYQGQQRTAQAFAACVDYLKEESTVIVLFTLINQYNFEIYPNKRSTSIDATYRHFILPYYPHLLKPLSIRFFKGAVTKHA